MTNRDVPRDQPRRLTDAVRDRLQLRHASPRTAEAYTGWIRRYIRFHGRRHPRELGAREVTAFLYRDVLDTPVGWLDQLIRAKRPHRVPTLLSRDEARCVIGAMHGVPRLIAMILYGSGVRLMEAVSLRVKDVDLDRRELIVRRGKGGIHR